MVQFYFLSVITNLLAGLLLSADMLEGKFAGLSSFKKIFEGNSSKMFFGVFTGIIGFLKFLSATEGDVVVVGDLLPAIFGLGMGIALVVDYYKSKSDVVTPAVENINALVVKNKGIIGILGLIVAFLHFLFPRVLFL